MADVALLRVVTFLALVHIGGSFWLHLPGESSLSTSPPDDERARQVPPVPEFKIWLAEMEKEEQSLPRKHVVGEDDDIRIVVGVFSSAGTKDKPHRDAIRNSWMRHPGICAATDHKPWRKECLVFASFVVGNSEPQEDEEPKRDVTVLNVSENMNHGKTMVWLRHAATVFPWATHLVKMDMDTYPMFDFVMGQLPTSGACPNYYGGHLCDGTVCRPGVPWCPGRHCGMPLNGNFTDYVSKDPECFVFVNGGFSVLTRQLALEISQPDGWWKAAAGRGEPEDVTTGRAVHEYATRTGACVATSNLEGIRHLR